MSEHELKRLRWRCRRGMKELDHLLLRWLEREWPAAGDERRAAFGALLATAAALAAIRRRDWTSLTLRGDGGATLRRAGGAEWIASLVDGAVLGPLVVLTLRGPDGRMTRLPLYPDAVDRETRRRLRVLLRYGWRAEPPGAIR